MTVLEASTMELVGNWNVTDDNFSGNFSLSQWKNMIPGNWSEETVTQLMNTAIANVKDNITSTPEGNTITSQPPITSILHYKIVHWLWLYFAPVLIFGGGISNILAIIVLRNQRLKGTGTSFLLTALAIADLIVLVTNVFRHWIIHLTNYDIDIRSLTDVGCRIHLFITYFGPQWSAWTLVLVTAERAVAVSMPFKVKVLCSRKRIVIAWVLSSMCLAVINSPIMAKYKLFVYSYPQPDNTTYVYKSCQPTSIYFRDTVLYWSDFALFNAGPCFLIFFLNFFIVIKLLQTKIDRHDNKKTKKTFTSVTITLFVVSLTFLVTTTPVVIYFLWSDSFFENAYTDVYVLADQSLAYAVCNLSAYINNAINFLLYFLSGGRFRKVITDMLCGRCIKKRP